MLRWISDLPTKIVPRKVCRCCVIQGYRPWPPIEETAGAEVAHRAENGFCADGDQEALVADGELEIGGRLPVNTDGGLIANGEPIGASGLRQVHEVVLQLLGQAGERQVPGGPKVGYTQLYGAPGVAGVSILSA
jgi:acetyl-CoA acetyltransferase